MYYKHYACEAERGRQAGEVEKPSNNNKKRPEPRVILFLFLFLFLASHEGKASERAEKERFLASYLWCAQPRHSSHSHSHSHTHTHTDTERDSDDSFFFF